MGDRRILLGTGAVLVGLSSALITGTAVAAADTGGTDTQHTGAPSAATSNPDSTAPSGRSGRGGTRTASTTGPASAASTNQDAPVVLTRGSRSNGSATVADVAQRRLPNRAFKLSIDQARCVEQITTLRGVPANAGWSSNALLISSSV